MTHDEIQIELAQRSFARHGIAVGQRCEADQRQLGPCRIVALGLLRGDLEPMVALLHEPTGVTWVEELKHFVDAIGSHKRWTLLEEVESCAETAQAQARQYVARKEQWLGERVALDAQRHMRMAYEEGYTTGRADAVAGTEGMRAVCEAAVQRVRASRVPTKFDEITAIHVRLEQAVDAWSSSDRVGGVVAMPGAAAPPTPRALWIEAHRDQERYIELLKCHGYLIPGLSKLSAQHDRCGGPVAQLAPDATHFRCLVCGAETWFDGTET